MVTKSNVEADKLYRLRVKRSVPVGLSGRMFLTPVTDNVVKGKVISGLADEAIESIEDVEQPQPDKWHVGLTPITKPNGSTISVTPVGMIGVGRMSTRACTRAS